MNVRPCGAAHCTPEQNQEMIALLGTCPFHLPTSAIPCLTASDPLCTSRCGMPHGEGVVAPIAARETAMMQPDGSADVVIRFAPP